MFAIRCVFINGQSTSVLFISDLFKDAVSCQMTQRRWSVEQWVWITGRRMLIEIVPTYSEENNSVTAPLCLPQIQQWLALVLCRPNRLNCTVQYYGATYSLIFRMALERQRLLVNCLRYLDPKSINHISPESSHTNRTKPRLKSSCVLIGCRNVRSIAVLLQTILFHQFWFALPK
jgi:hypothetical protein